MEQIYFLKKIKKEENDNFINEEKFLFFRKSLSLKNVNQFINVDSWSLENINKLIKYLSSTNKSYYLVYDKWNNNMRILNKEIHKKQKHYLQEEFINDKLKNLKNLIINKNDINRIFSELKTLDDYEKISLCLILFKYSRSFEVQKILNLAINTNLISLKQALTFAIFNLWGLN